MKAVVWIRCRLTRTAVDIHLHLGTSRLTMGDVLPSPHHGRASIVELETTYTYM